MTIELTKDEIFLIIKALTTGQFPMAQHDAVFYLVTRLRKLLES